MEWEEGDNGEEEIFEERTAKIFQNWVIDNKPQIPASQRILSSINKTLKRSTPHLDIDNANCRKSGKNKILKEDRKKVW